MARIRPIVDAQQARLRRGEAHPIVDFIFQYYNVRPGRLLQWSPGLGVTLELGPSVSNAADPAGSGWQVKGERCWLEPSQLSDSDCHRLSKQIAVLEAIQKRSPRFACFGLHEWAMIYEAGDQRHRQLPLRVDHAKLRDIVEAQPLPCTHFDAYRHFSLSARPFNVIALGPHDRLQRDQPGCLHVNMDLFGVASRWQPWVGSALLADCLQLALEIRELDMRASPYDVSAFSLEAIAIETAAGRRVYQRMQQDFAARAVPLRQRLHDSLVTLYREARSGNLTEVLN
ncbi:3-methyladenine DNA glycosylase [Gammaproteobacteria bacterium]|nr:3-methyladenine DNA glycosylase [Gammaproteobacteria bacterium]